MNQNPPANYVEITYDDGTVARWIVTEAQLIQLENILGQPETIKL